MNEYSNERRAGSFSDRSSLEPMTTEPSTANPHSFFSNNRASMVIRGVTDVMSFDEYGVFLVTTCGQLNVEGTDLHVTVLNTKDGIVEVTGKLCGLFYDDHQTLPSAGSDKHKGKRGFFRRLLS